MTSEKRVCVQGNGKARDVDAHPPGTITWSEHERAWQAYDRKWRSGQSAQRIAERGGFAYEELVEFLGRDPETWEAR